MIDVAIAMEQGQSVDRVLPAVLGRQPTGAVREEEKAKEEDRSRNNLDTPGDAECRSRLVGVVRSAANLGGAVLDEILNEDTPGNGPLLQRDDAAADLLGRDLGLVDWHNRRGDTDAETCDNTSSTEHANVSGGTLNASDISNCLLSCRLRIRCEGGFETKGRVTYIEPMVQMMQATWMAILRENRSAMKEETSDPTL